METWIRSASRTRVYRQLAAWALIVLAVIVFIVLNRTYVKNFFANPHGLTGAELSTIGNLDQQEHQFVTVTGTKVLDTGVEEIKTEGGTQVYHHFYAMVVDGKFLIVRVNDKAPDLKVSGRLQPITDTLAYRLFRDTDASLKAKTYPVFLSTDNYRKPGYFAIAGLLVLAFLLWKVARPAWGYARDISRHPAVVRAEGWAYAQNTAMNAEREMTTEVRYKRPGILMTTNFVIQRGFFSFNVFRFDDLMWIYKKITRHSVNFIPTGKTYEGVMVFSDGQAGFGGKEKMTDEMIAFVANRAPWATVGYTDELAKMIRKDPKGFRAAVEARKTVPSGPSETGTGSGL